MASPRSIHLVPSGKELPPRRHAPSGPGLVSPLTLARTVHDTWVLEMSIFYRLFHSLHRHVGLLSGRRVDSVAQYNEVQVGNLRRNMIAVFELTEWILFHSPCSFLTAPTQLALGVPDVDKLPVATRADNHMDEATRDEAIREMLQANAQGESAGSDELPGGGGGGGEEEGKDGGPQDTQVGTPNSTEVEGETTGELQRISSAPSTPSGPSSLLKTDVLPSSATILRASQRGVDEPLSAEEIEVFTLLLTGIVDQFPMPDKRQDVLRIIFRYLMVVLPHPLCAPLTPTICDSVQRLFLERITEKVEKNTRLVALTLSLLKTGMEQAIRRQDLENVERVKRCIGMLYHQWGDIVFLDNFTPAAQWAPPTPAAAPRVPFSPSSASSFPTTTPLPSAQAAQVEALAPTPAPAATAAAGTGAGGNGTDPIDDASEAALFRLYQGDGRVVMQSTQTVFLQHQQRFSYLSEVRAAKVHASIVDYLRRKRANEAIREKKFSLGSTTVLRQSQQAKTFLLPHYALKRGRPQYRIQERDERQVTRVHRAIKQYRGQAMNSRPLPLPLPPPHPDLLRSHLQSVKDQLNASPAASPYAYSTPSSLRLLFSHSRLVEYWKLDSTESPTRMRRLLKKNFTSGDPHTYASAHANVNAQKQMYKANEAIDLMRVKLITTGESEGGEQGGVDVNADVEAGKEEAALAEAEKAKLLAAAEDDDEGAGEDQEEGGDTREADADEDEVDDEVEEGTAGPTVKRSSKVILSHFATMITPTHKFIGIIKVTTTSLSFSGIEHTVLVGAEVYAPVTPQPQVKTDEGEGKKKPVKLREKHIKWSLKQLRMVLPRYFLLRESALEIFANNFKNYFFNFTPLTDDVLASLMGQPAYASLTSNPSLSRQHKKWKSGREQRNELYKLLCTLVPDMQFELSPGRRLLKSGIMKAWQRGEVSNFDYLMHLNTIAGRSYNDINQYPVFPWVLTDYKSEMLDLENPSIYRDLSKPIGALNADRFEIFNDRFQGFEDETIPPFLYGSHYSSAGIALHYLIRCEPFTSLAISLQGGRFDLPDRLFDSIAGSWELSYSNMADVKELIPEFFYQPDFLRNVNHLDLGTKQDHTKLGDVILPPWASTPEEFVRINREALESDYVSSHLHEWIDLIFGFKQKGKAAVDAANVFFYLTYAGSVDIDAIDNVALRKATEDQIANFGQTPMQLLTSPHPRRFSAGERMKVSTGRITLPLRLPSTYTSQLIHNYQGVRRAAKAKATEEDRRALLSLIPTSICFTYHDVVITITPGMGIQSHALSTFINAPPTLLYPAHEHMQGIWQATDPASSSPSTPAVEAPDFRLLNRRGAGMVVDPSASKAPSAAQFIPGSVVASHILHPMCPHWFLSPVPLPSSLPSGSPSPPTSSSSAEQKSRALAPRSGRELYHPAITTIARNAKFIFTGGYFDGSIKCHALVHSKAHLEGEGGMGGGQQSQHVMAALAARGDDPSNLQRPPPKTQATLDVKPLSSVRAHRGVVTAMTLSLNQMILISGDEEGCVLIWRAYLDRQERSRPPIASTPLAAFSIHEGRVVAVDTNTVIGIAISLGMDVQRSRGCEVAVYSIRGGAARFMHSIVMHDTDIDLSLCALTATSNIVLYGTKGGIPTLWLYSLNGFFLTSTPTLDVLSVLTTTPNLSRTVNANDGLIVTGGRRGQVVFRYPHNLELVQTYFTDDQFPHTAPHGLPAFGAAAAQGGQPVAPPVGDGAAGGGGGSAFAFVDAEASPAEVSAPSSPSSEGGEAWTVVENKAIDLQAKRKAIQAEAQAFALAHPPDPAMEVVYTDPTLRVQMGISAIDVSRSQKHFVVAVYPDPDLISIHALPPSHPLAVLYGGVGESVASTAEGRLLLFPLPFSIDPQSYLGFYVDYAASTLDSLKDTVNGATFARISEARDMALEAVERARDRLSGQREQAGKKMTEVKSKVFGAFNSLFGGKKGGGQGQAGVAQPQLHPPQPSPGTVNMRGGMVNAPVARAIPRQGSNM